MFVHSANFLTNNPGFWPEQILAKMSLRQKIGQLFVVAAASNFSQPTEVLASSMLFSPYNMQTEHIEMLIKDYHVGGVIFLYKSDPATQILLAQKFKNLAQTPLIFMQDSEWGLGMRLDLDPAKVVQYPHNMTLGAITDDQIIYDVGYEIGRQCAAVGIHMNLAPVIDVNSNPDNPVIHDRSFGDNSERVAKLATLIMQGMQAGGVLTCAKHFPGHGDTKIDSHFGLPKIKHDRLRLDRVELVPFKALIKNHVDAIMMGHLLLPALEKTHTPASLSQQIVTKLLQKELAFNGLKITDGLGMGAVMLAYAAGEAELQAVLAGNDIVLCPLNVPKAIKLIERAIKTGKLSLAELDARVLKILRAKANVYFKQALLNNLTDVGAFLIRPAAYELQARAYRAALTLITNNDKIDLSSHFFKKSNVIQIGSLPDDMFAKTIQSARYEPARAPRSEFVEPCELSVNKFNSYSSKFDHNDLKQAQDGAKNAVNVVIALGDLNKNVKQNFGIASNVLELVKQLKNKNKNVLVVLFGTPYSAKLFKSADLVLVAYENLPVIQVGAVDVLLGKLKPLGRLPVTLK